MLGAPIASRGYGSVQFGQGTQLVPCQLFILKVKHFGSQISHFRSAFSLHSKTTVLSQTLGRPSQLSICGVFVHNVPFKEILSRSLIICTGFWCRDVSLVISQ